MSCLKFLAVPLLLGVLLPAAAQEMADVERSSFPQGIVVDGNAEFRAHQFEAASASVGESNVSGNAAAAVRSSVQIQGNTRIKAEQTNATAVAVGKDNAVKNEAGVIGGK